MDQLANLGEFIGGFAVVVSLLFVGFQIRASVKQSRLDAYSEIAELFTQYTTAIFTSESASEIYTRGMRDYHSLDPVEQNRFNLMLAMYVGIIDTVMMHKKEGIYPSDQAYERMMKTLDGLFAQPGVRSWWKEQGDAIPVPNVAEYVKEGGV